MRLWVPIAIGFVACSSPSRTPKAPAGKPAIGSPAPAPVRAAVTGQSIDPKTAVPFGRLAAIQLTANDHAVSIDEAGAVRVSSSPLFGPQVGLVGVPFSQPVDEVVFVQHVSTANVPGAPSGIVYCARTRAATLECVTDYTRTEPDGQRTRVVAYRFALPAERVTHIAIAPPPSEPIVCAASAASTCWRFERDGRRAEPYPADEATAAMIATKLPSTILDSWRRAEPDVTVAHARKVLVSDSQDGAHITGASIAVYCALLEGGALSCFGPGVYGELGDGTLNAKPRASRPLGTARVLDVAMHGRYVCAVVDDGRLACWGKLPDGLPVGRGKPTPLPMCPLDRAASQAKFAATHQRELDASKACIQSCKANPVRDCMLSCGPSCEPLPYLFRHDTHCQEPLDVTQLASRHFGDRCAAADQSPRWLPDKDLRDNTPAVELTLTPSYVTGVTDAVKLAVWGPRVCVVRKSGALQCIGT